MEEKGNLAQGHSRCVGRSLLRNKKKNYESKRNRKDPSEPAIKYRKTLWKYFFLFSLSIQSC